MAEGTLQDLRDALWDNGDFEEVGSVAKAKAYITAATRWLALEPASQSDQGSSLSFAPAQVERLMQRARAFVAANSNSSSINTGVRFLSASSGFRR